MPQTYPVPTATRARFDPAAGRWGRPASMMLTVASPPRVPPSNSAPACPRWAVPVRCRARGFASGGNHGGDVPPTDNPTMATTDTTDDSTRPTADPMLKDLTGFQKTLLYVIADLGDPHGLAVKEAIEADYEEEQNHGRLYPNLDELVEKGLIVKGERDRRSNEYKLTDRGRRVIRANEAWNREHVGHLLED